MDQTTEGERLRHEPTLLEKKADGVFKGYFGNDWQNQLQKYLLIEDVRQADNEDIQREGGNVGWVGTAANVKEFSRIEGNHLVMFNYRGAEDYPLRTELGEALWNLLENTAITGNLPFNTKKYVLAEGFKQILESRANTGKVVHPQEVVGFAKEILDKWNKAYDTRPQNRYTGMGASPTRDYNQTPEWKSEGFSDAVAIQIRRKSGLGLNNYEQSIWNSLKPQARDIAEVCVDQFLPAVQVASQAA